MCSQCGMLLPGVWHADVLRTALHPRQLEKQEGSCPIACCSCHIRCCGQAAVLLTRGRSSPTRLNHPTLPCSYATAWRTAADQLGDAACVTIAVMDTASGKVTVTTISAAQTA